MSETARPASLTCLGRGGIPQYSSMSAAMGGADTGSEAFVAFDVGGNMGNGRACASPRGKRSEGWVCVQRE